MFQAPSLAEDGPACCYICDLADTPGRFQPEKAKALGVPMGPLFGRLKGGQTVTLPNGNTVQPADVCLPVPLTAVFALQLCYLQCTLTELEALYNPT